jgi:uncharacterized protein
MRLALRLLSGEAFHAGERYFQSRLGVEDQMAQIGQRFIRPEMPEQHREFFAGLPLVFLGAIDAAGLIWASLRLGSPGFVSSSRPDCLSIQGTALSGDPLASLAVGQSVGLLGLEFDTRRRNRANGEVTASGEQTEIAIQQSFGNCPKYIHPQVMHTLPRQTQKQQSFTQWIPEAVAIIESAHTFFIASAYTPVPAFSNTGVDISHRGGDPGFVKIKDEKTLSFADYKGNRFFNTLGNLQLNPQSGLLFVDVKKAQILYLTGHATTHWGEDLHHADETGRVTVFGLTEGRLLQLGAASSESAS